MKKRMIKEKKKERKIIWLNKYSVLKKKKISMYIVIVKEMNIIFINFLGWMRIIFVDRRIFVEIVVFIVWNSVFFMIIYFLIWLF